MGLLVIGAGGHGKVVMDILLANQKTVLGYVDGDETTWGSTRLNQPVLGAVERWRELNASGLVMGIGSSRVRKTLVERLGADAPWRTAIHPSAIVAPSAQLGTGVVIAAGAIINPDAVIGDFAIINTGATVDHDCVIGSYAHIAPGTNLAGSVRIGEGTLVGVGARVIPGQTIGAWAVIGAGAVVIRSVPDGVTAVGVPARWPTESPDGSASR